jgi:uncharacterized Zn finger protein (UPF0148 family)
MVIKLYEASDLSRLPDSMMDLSCDACNKVFWVKTDDISGSTIYCPFCKTKVYSDYEEYLERFLEITVESAPDK